jgi:hypothetical protein
LDGRRSYRQRLRQSQVTLNFLEQFNHEIGVPHGNACKRLAAGQIQQVPDVVHEGSAPGLKKKAAGPAIRRIVTSLQPPAALQVVEGSRQSHRLEIGQLCQVHLTDPFVIDQMYEHLALREGQAENSGSFLEALRVQTNRALEKKAESAGWVQVSDVLPLMVLESLRLRLPAEKLLFLDVIHRPQRYMHDHPHCRHLLELYVVSRDIGCSQHRRRY